MILTAKDLGNLKQQLIDGEYNEKKVKKAIAYLMEEMKQEKSNVAKHNVSELYSLVVKYINAGTNLDGINVNLLNTGFAESSCCSFSSSFVSSAIFAAALFTSSITLLDILPPYPTIPYCYWQCKMCYALVSFVLVIHKVNQRVVC